MMVSVILKALADDRRKNLVLSEAWQKIFGFAYSNILSPRNCCPSFSSTAISHQRFSRTSFCRHGAIFSPQDCARSTCRGMPSLTLTEPPCECPTIADIKSRITRDRLTTSFVQCCPAFQLRLASIFLIRLVIKF